MYITKNLADFERQQISQFGEDGVIERLAFDIGIDKGTFFEFGIGPRWQSTFEESGLEGNFVLLRKKGWQGIFLDGNEHPRSAGVSREFITPLNINLLYRKYQLPADLDFMSIDIDGQEFWVWMMLTHRPKVMIVEYNGWHGPDVSVAMKYDPGHVWDQTRYYGASLRALDKLAKAKEYTFVWCNGVNAIFVRDDIISNKSDFVFEDLYKGTSPFGEDPQKRQWVEI
jgi:hypothetical protein